MKQLLLVLCLSGAVIGVGATVGEIAFTGNWPGGIEFNPTGDTPSQVARTARGLFVVFVGGIAGTLVGGGTGFVLWLLHRVLDLVFGGPKEKVS